MADFFKDGCQLYSPRVLGYCRKHSGNGDRSLKSERQICSYEGTFSEKRAVMIKIYNGGFIQDGCQMGSYL